MDDRPVQNTAQDALSSKQQILHSNANLLGYISDPYTQFFCTTSSKKPPIINRGYWARSKRFSMTIQQFLSAEYPQKQIINLGAGFDTTYWMLKPKQYSYKLIELDFQQICQSKIRTIQEHPQLNSQLEGIFTDSEYTSQDYCILNVDLRKAQELIQKIGSYINFQYPTLIMAQCVLVYLNPDDSDLLLQRLSSVFPNSAFISYDIIKPDDPMGRTMIENLSLRGIILRGIHAYPSVQAQVNRFKKLFSIVQGKNMLQIYNTCLQRQEKARIESIQWMDEFEEWEMLLSHYCIILACKDSISLTLNLT